MELMKNKTVCVLLILVFPVLAICAGEGYAQGAGNTHPVYVNKAPVFEPGQEGSKIKVVKRVVKKPAGSGASKYDKEHIVDVNKLKESTVESLKSLEERLGRVNLNEKFDNVFKALEDDPVDNRKLKTALERLEKAIDDFRSDWDSTIEPLWRGQMLVGDTISKVRSILAKSNTDKAKDPHMQKEMEKYDAKLRELSIEIKNEPDPKRKERMKLLFRNLYNLKKIKTMKVNLNPASEIVLARMIETLEKLELQFTRVIFTAEESYAVLGNQQQFLHDYIQIVKGLIDVEDLAEWFASGNTDESLAMTEGILQQFEMLNGGITDFEDALNSYSGNMIESIEKHSDAIKQRLDDRGKSGSSQADKEIDSIIEEYSKMGVE